HEVSSLREMQRHWQRLHDYAARLFATQGLDDVVAEEVANPPGMDEDASLMWIKHYAERAEHDVLIVDCAPTGATLQFPPLPDLPGGPAGRPVRAQAAHPPQVRRGGGAVLPADPDPAGAALRPRGDRRADAREDGEGDLRRRRPLGAHVPGSAAEDREGRGRV